MSKGGNPKDRKEENKNHVIGRAFFSDHATGISQIGAFKFLLLFIGLSEANKRRGGTYFGVKINFTSKKY